MSVFHDICRYRKSLSMTKRNAFEANGLSARAAISERMLLDSCQSSESDDGTRDGDVLERQMLAMEEALLAATEVMYLRDQHCCRLVSVQLSGRSSRSSAV